MPAKKPKNKGGRPCKFDADTCVFMTLAFKQNMPLAVIAKHLGIGYRTILQWMKQGRDGDARFQYLSELSNESIARRNKFNSKVKRNRYNREFIRAFKNNDWPALFKLKELQS